jgi:diguanylate cyclase (GGDEF)-like protein
MSGSTIVKSPPHLHTVSRAGASRQAPGQSTQPASQTPQDHSQQHTAQQHSPQQHNSQQQNTQQQHYLATHDLLTGLRNKKMFIERVTQEIKYCERYQFQFAMLLLDLNHFKLVNQEFGVSFGDLVLREVAKRIKACVRTTDTVARWKADQFLILLTNITAAQEVARIAHKILATFTQPLKLEQQDYVIHASASICLYPEDGKVYEVLFQRLCQTLPRVKQSNTTRCQFYNLEISQSVDQQTDVENALKRSLFQNDVQLHYQPVVDVRHGEVAQLSAGLAWESDMIPASVVKLFADELLEQPLVDGLDDWALQTACEQMQQWRGQGVKDYRLAVEISAQQFMDFNLLEKLRHCLSMKGVDASRLVLEIREQTVLDNVDQSLDFLARLKQLGIAITLSNFGHGHTYLSLLKVLPVDYIKLSPSLIENIEHSRSDQAVMRGIITIANGLCKPVIALGVESIGQLSALSQLKCKLMQGPIIHQALSPAEVVEL